MEIAINEGTSLLDQVKIQARVPLPVIQAFLSGGVGPGG